MKPLVSVCLITDQHERYLERSLDGVLDQVVDFDIEVVVGVDCCTDRPRAIIDASVRQADGVMRPLYRPRNPGLESNFLYALAHCSGGNWDRHRCASDRHRRTAPAPNSSRSGTAPPCTPMSTSSRFAV